MTIRLPSDPGMCFLCGRRRIAWRMDAYRDLPGLGIRKGDIAGYCDTCRPHIALQVDLAERGVVTGRISS